MLILLVNYPLDILTEKDNLDPAIGKNLLIVRFFLQKREFMRPIAVLSAEGDIMDQTESIKIILQGFRQNEIKTKKFIIICFSSRSEWFTDSFGLKTASNSFRLP